MKRKEMSGGEGFLWLMGTMAVLTYAVELLNGVLK